jgi:hypothetical protein
MGSVDSLAHNRNHWSVLVNIMIKLQIPYKTRNFLPSWAYYLLACKEKLCLLEWLCVGEQPCSKQSVIQLSLHIQTLVGKFLFSTPQ